MKKRLLLAALALLLMLGLGLATAEAASALSAPVMKQAQSGTKGVKLTWKKVSGAEGYVVYRKKDGASKYTRLATVTGRSYLDTSAKEGTAYQYQVAAWRRENGKRKTGPRSEALTGAKFAKVLVRTAAGRGDTSIRLTWSASAKASYEVRSATHGKTKYTVLTSKTSKTAYTAKKLKAGRLYDFVVVPKLKLKDGTWLEGPASPAFAALAVSPVEITSVEQTDEGMALSWTASKYAKGYTVYRKTDGDWEQIGQSVSERFTDTSLSVGQACSYRVEAYNTKKGVTSVSARSDAESAFRLGSPEITGLTLIQADQLLLTWSEAAGADGYEVSASCGDTPTLFRTADVKLYHDDLASGEAYTYRVRAWRRNAAGELQYSPWSAERSYTIARIHRALLIGNTYPGTSLSLPGPDVDIAAMRGMLASMEGSDYVITSKANLTAAGITSAIASAFGQAQACDVSLLYYSGHGSSGSSITGELGSLVGTDGGHVTPAMLRRALDQIPGIKIVILDSCYSGAHVGDYSAKDANQAVIRAFSRPVQERSYPEAKHFSSGDSQKTVNRAAQDTLTAEGYYVITACGSTEESLSYDNFQPTPGTYVGLMTCQMLLGCGWDEKTNAAASSSPADANGDGVFAFSEVVAYTLPVVRQLAAQLGYPQHMMYYPSNSGEALWQR